MSRAHAYSCHFKILEGSEEPAGVYRQVLDEDGNCIGFIDVNGYLHSCNKKPEPEAIRRIRIYRGICIALLLVTFALLMWVLAHRIEGFAETRNMKSFRPMGNDFAANHTDESKLTEKLIKRARAINRNLPFLINNSMSLNAVTVESTPSKQMTFHYQILSRTSAEVDREKFYRSMRYGSVNRACNDPELIYLLQQGIKVGNSYWGSDNRLIADIGVDRRDCKFNR